MGTVFHYRKANYKYQLTRPVYFKLGAGLWPENSYSDNFIGITRTGELTIFKGYAWDGASGPTWDDDSNMFGALIHDALYQLMRLGVLPTTCRHAADLTFQRLCRANGMGKFRAWYYFEGVENFAKAFTDKSKEPPELEAPANIP